jgi:hypothetical protein
MSAAIGLCGSGYTRPCRPGRRLLEFNETLDEETLHSHAYGSAMYGRPSRKSSCRSRPVVCVPLPSPHAASD